MAVGVVFDGDDTLWSTERLYDEARSVARAIVASCGLDADKWEELERRTDVENVMILGHSSERFPSSCVQAYEYICGIEGRAPNPSVARQIWCAARSVFERDAPVIPSARATLGRLRANRIRLALLTKGEPTVQNRRLTSSGLHDFFELVEIVSEKSPSAIRAVIARLGVDLESSWMVGNSVRSDILPALAAGLRAIWINAHVWEYESAPNDLIDERVVRVRSLAEVPDLILP